MDGQTLRDLDIKVSQYFLDFLDSDFRKAQAPRRRIVQQTDAGFRAGMRTSPYPSLQHALSQILAKPVGGGLELRFPPRAHQRPISANLKAVIKENIEAIPASAVEAVRADVLRQAKETIGQSVENPETWIDGVRQALCIAVATDIVRPLLALLDGPGTGKSHTITAIAFQGILKGRSTLILSDKTEALDVVQDKLTQTMSRARHDDQFPNPILRLGRDHANFKRLTSNQTLMQVQAYVKSNAANKPRLDADLISKKSHLQDQVAMTVKTLCELPLTQISQLQRVEAELEALVPGLPIELQHAQVPAQLGALVPKDVKSVTMHIASIYRSNPNCSAAGLQLRLRIDAAIVEFAINVDRKLLSIFDSLDTDSLRQLANWVIAYRQLRMPLFGYLFRGTRVRTLEVDLNNQLRPNRPVLLREHAAQLEQVVLQAQSVRQDLLSKNLDEAMLPQIYSAIVKGAIPGPEANAALQLVVAVRQSLGESVPSALNGSAPATKSGQIWTTAADYISRWTHTLHTFSAAPSFDYVGEKSQIERLNVGAMNAEVDSRLVNFMDHHRAEARALSSVISARQKFPEDRFESVKQAFPVVLASIREFGEYMPLLPDLFDVVIIDEGSQVSIAQVSATCFL